MLSSWFAPSTKTQRTTSVRIERFEEIEAWGLARQLCRDLHQRYMVGAWSKDFALRDQIDRASGSIMDNIAEGFDGGSHAEFARFLGYAQRSCSEVQSQLYRALDRNYLDRATFDQLYGATALTRSKTTIR